MNRNLPSGSAVSTPGMSLPSAQPFMPMRHTYQAPPPGGYNPPPAGGYPPQGGGYPPQGGGYPPQGGGYPPQGGGYPPQGGGYPPQGGGYPPPPGPPAGDGQQAPKPPSLGLTFNHKAYFNNTLDILKLNWVNWLLIGLVGTFAAGVGFWGGFQYCYLKAKRGLPFEWKDVLWPFKSGKPIDLFIGGVVAGFGSFVSQAAWGFNTAFQVDRGLKFTTAMEEGRKETRPNFVPYLLFFLVAALLNIIPFIGQAASCIYVMEAFAEKFSGLQFHAVQQLGGPGQAAFPAQAAGMVPPLLAPPYGQPEAYPPQAPPPSWGAPAQQAPAPQWGAPAQPAAPPGWGAPAQPATPPGWGAPPQGAQSWGPPGPPAAQAPAGPAASMGYGTPPEEDEHEGAAATQAMEIRPAIRNPDGSFSCSYCNNRLPPGTKATCPFCHNLVIGL